MGPVTLNKNHHYHHYGIQPSNNHFKSSSTSTTSTSCKTCKKCGAPCPLCVCPAPPTSPLESKWSDEDWNGYRHREREERKKEQQEKKETEQNKKEDSVQKDYCPPSPIYNPSFKEDTIPAQIEKKQYLDQNHYSSNYVPNYGEDAPTLVNNLIPKAAPLTKGDRGEDTKGDKGEDTKGDKGEDTKGDRGEDKDERAQMEEDSGEDADNDDYSDSDYIY